MYRFTTAQVRAARGLLNWSQNDLAQAADLGITTIRTLESGFAPRMDTLKKIRIALEGSGIEFTEGEGVRLRDDEIRVFRGPDNREIFFNDVLQTLIEQGGDIIAAVQSQDLLMRMFEDSSDRLERLSQIAPMKCILAEVSQPLPFPQSFQFRTLHKHYIGPCARFVYGDRDVEVIGYGGSEFKFVVFRSPSFAQSWRSHYLALWELATPMLIQAAPENRRRIHAV